MFTMCHLIKESNFNQYLIMSKMYLSEGTFFQFSKRKFMLPT